MEIKTVSVDTLNVSNVLGLAKARETINRSGDIYEIDLDKIAIRVDANGKRFNKRKDFGDLEAFGEGLVLHSQQQPLKGDLNSDGIFLPSNGERRYRAMVLMAARGLWTAKVKIVLNPKETTDEQRLLQQLSGNDNKEFTPLEKANIADDFRRQDKSLAEIGKLMNMSSMMVHRLLGLLDLSTEEQEAVSNGVISPTAAIDLAKALPSAAERMGIIKKAEDAGDKVKVGDVEAIKAAAAAPAPPAEEPEVPQQKIAPADVVAKPKDTEPQQRMKSKTIGTELQKPEDDDDVETGADMCTRAKGIVFELKKHRYGEQHEYLANLDNLLSDIRKLFR